MLSREQAERLTSEAQSTLEDFGALMVQLYEGKADVVLGFETWGDYVKAHFPTLPRYSRADRPEVVQQLTAAGMTRREVAATLAIGHDTVQRDIDDHRVLNRTERSTDQPDRYRSPTKRRRSHDVRKLILGALDGGHATVHQIAERTGVAHSTVGNHLRAMVKDGEVRQGHLSEDDDGPSYCPILTAEVVATPFAWYGNKIREYADEIMTERELTAPQNKALARVLNAVDLFVATDDLSP